MHSQARVLCLGLGGGVLPMILQHYFGSSGHLQLSAVELDQTITHAATMHMGLDPHFGRHKAGLLAASPPCLAQGPACHSSNAAPIHVFLFGPSFLVSSLASRWQPSWALAR